MTAPVPPKPGMETMCDHGNRVCIYDDVPDTQEAVMFAPDGWDERTQSPVDEQAESLRDADPPDESCEPPVCHNPGCPISLFEHTVGHGECAPTSTEPTAYLDSDFADGALTEIIRYGMDNNRSPAEVAGNVLAHLRMHRQFRDPAGTPDAGGP